MNAELTPTAGTMVRQELGATQMVANAETSSTAVAAHAAAAVQARYAMAMRNPRDWDVVRTKFLKTCERPRFAEKAIWRLKFGKEPIEGPSIRFAEEAIRCMGNMLPEEQVVYEDIFKRIVRISLTDLEANITFTKDILIEKTVERSFAEGRIVIASRTNSAGKPVYIVAATESELGAKQASLASKALRGLVIRALPADIKEDALDKCYEVRNKNSAEDPDKQKKRIVDAFANLGVSAAELKAYLKRSSLDGISDRERQELLSIYTAISDGEAKWSDYVSSEEKEGAMKKEDEGPRDEAKERLKRTKEKLAQDEKKEEPAADNSNGED